MCYIRSTVKLEAGSEGKLTDHFMKTNSKYKTTPVLWKLEVVDSFL